MGATGYEDDHLDVSRLGSSSRVTVIGDPDVGKRSIVRQTMTSEYMHGKTDSSPTNGKLPIYNRSRIIDLLNAIYNCLQRNAMSVHTAFFDII